MMLSKIIISTLTMVTFKKVYKRLINSFVENTFPESTILNIRTIY